MRIFPISMRLWLALLVMLLAACQLAPTPAPTPTRRVRVPFVIPTDEPIPTATPITIPSPTPIPANELCPLTGLRDAARPWASRRPLLIKIDNAPLARPQSGLLAADLIIEHLAEGGVTRFNAIFWCSDAPNIGPIRSARLIDLELLPMFQGLLVNVGASNEVWAMLRQAFAAAMLDEALEKEIFRRIPERQAPHNTYTSSATLWQFASQRGINQSNLQLKGLTFSATPPTSALKAEQVTIPYSVNFADSLWEYTSTTHSYKKFLLGQPLMDAATNQQAQAANVVVIFAPHSETEIIEDSLGSRSIKIELMGRGRALVFREGMVREGQWLRTERNTLLRVVDANNQDIALRAGRSWFEVVPTDLNVMWR